MERALKKVPGVTQASVNLATESARVGFEPSEQMEARLRRAVRDAGYEPLAADAMDAVAACGRAGFGRRWVRVHLGLRRSFGFVPDGFA